MGHDSYTEDMKKELSAYGHKNSPMTNYKEFCHWQYKQPKQITGKVTLIQKGEKNAKNRTNNQYST